MVLSDCLSGLVIDAEPFGPGGQAQARWRQVCPVAAGRRQNVEDEFLFPRARALRVGRRYTRIGHGRPGAWNRVTGVRAGSMSARPRGRSGMSGWQAQSESAHVGWRPSRIDASTGRAWPRPTAGTMERIVAVDGTPSESN